MQVAEKNGLAQRSEVELWPAKPGAESQGTGFQTRIPQWKLSFWTRWEHESGMGRLIEVWCHSEDEARRCFGEYRRILESHTQIITKVELLAPSGEQITTV
jgi:hypothetical protein